MTAGNLKRAARKNTYHPVSFAGSDTRILSYPEATVELASTVGRGQLTAPFWHATLEVPGTRQLLEDVA
jgi:hypothetical protein